MKKEDFEGKVSKIAETMIKNRVDELGRKIMIKHHSYRVIIKIVCDY
jgi:hypothetical protein